MLTCQFALYPLRTEEIGPRLEAALAELDRLGVSYQVGTMSTELRGDEEVVSLNLCPTFYRTNGFRAPMTASPKSCQ